MPVHEFPPDPAMFVPFQLTFSDKLLSQSMGVIMRLQNHVMKHFSLPQPTLLLGAVSTGSTVVSFHFPRVEERVSSLARKSSGFFSELNVETVSIDNHGIGTLPAPVTQVSLKSLLFQFAMYVHFLCLAPCRLCQAGMNNKLGQFMVNSLGKEVLILYTLFFNP